MDAMRPERVSVIDPIEPAIERVRTMLFRPFDLSKWFIIGFCAWLAHLGRGSGGQGFNFQFPGGEHRWDSGKTDLTAVKEAIAPYLLLVIAGAAILVLLSFIIALVLCWLRSRGLFMFVHCIAGNKAEVVVPWKNYSRHGNSLFLFKIVFVLISLLCLALPIAILVVAIIIIAKAELIAAGVMGIIGAVCLIVIISIIVGLVIKFVDDFVVPIMALHTASTLAGCKIFLSLMSCNKARMALYILFQFIISMAIGIIASLVCLVACCCCCCTVVLFALPYIGTVILLPLFVFKRAYSLYYLRQFGPQFDVFIPQPS
ncbi:MAG: hypothetical protein JW749_02425 [Sedimentisphaerales bacterium]|nr:hypothetical protein [Sedimentisphaerales bacterium]